jgi:hypothetical protein
MDEKQFAVEYRIVLPVNSKEEAEKMSDEIDTAMTQIMREIGATWISAEIYTY